jgi:hypothetical protein
MRNLRLFLCAFAMAASVVSAAYAGAPDSIVGIKLGTPIQDLHEMVDLGAAVPIWGSDYLLRVPLRFVKGYQSGYVVYGNCAQIGKVLRIKLTYEDESEEFFGRVLHALTQRYGKPSEWRGNPFGTLKIWKWSLRDAHRERTSIILQHYVGDDDTFTQGNSIRLTDSTLIEGERACYESKRKDKKTASCPELTPEKIDFDWFLPR